MRKIDEELASIAQAIDEKNRYADEQSEKFAAADTAYSDLNKSIEDRQAELVPKEQESNDLQAQFQENRKSLTDVLVNPQTLKLYISADLV